MEGRPDDDRRPADVLVPHWTGGLDTAWDVTMIHPLQASTVAGAAASPGHLLRQTGQEERECQSHLFQCLSIVLVRGNCALFVNRIPDIITADIDGQE